MPSMAGPTSTSSTGSWRPTRSGRTGSRSLHPFGNPIYLSHLQNPVQSHAFELSGWPPATYRLEVEVTDNMNGERSVNGTTIHVH